MGDDRARRLAAGRRPEEEDVIDEHRFDEVYRALTSRVLEAAERRGDKRVLALRHPTIARARPWAVPTDDLLGLPDTAFIENCYLLLLNRVPRRRELAEALEDIADDPKGRRSLLDRLHGSTEHAGSDRTVRLT